MYQLCKRIGDFTPTTWGDVKGKKPTHINIDGEDLPIRFLSQYYNMLWWIYLKNNPELIAHARTFDDFHDKFKGKSINCQADVIRMYVLEGEEAVFNNFNELLRILQS